MTPTKFANMTEILFLGSRKIKSSVTQILAKVLKYFQARAVPNFGIMAFLYSHNIMAILTKCRENAFSVN